MGDSQTKGRFEDVRWLRNHWSRRTGRRGYYWFLTFENATELHSLAKECQEAIAFPYYDPISPEGLHLTLDRIAFEGDISAAELSSIVKSSASACQRICPFEISIGKLGGTRGAIGFTVGPLQPLRILRNAFRSATLEIYPEAPVKSDEFLPHVSIAYANSDGVDAADAVKAVTGINSTHRMVGVPVTEAKLVLLEQQEHSYSWQVISRIPLSGSNGNTAEHHH
ncbi:2'-5' RNA ligase family protein [Nocardia sp. NPDC046763]|uniref:2'-5' RNA ligase family protein n=1 Tax=Nocardia sp. NPDC046763 TaxID=3155256 RepID=UPI0033F2B015